MVFVTVGTHEQPFDRLMREIEHLVAVDALKDVTVQYGYSTVQPAGCRCEKFLPYAEMCCLYAESNVVICHGGPSTFLEAMSYGKVPVVVPRLASFGEHVNDHQLSFAQQFADRMGGIEVVSDTAMLSEAIERAKNMLPEKNKTNNTYFCEKLTRLVKGLA